MVSTKLFFCLSVFVVTNAFVFGPMFGHKDQCQMDGDCDNGCCLRVHSSTGSSYNKCSSYTLPAGTCIFTLAGNITAGCGCMPGYYCRAPPGIGGLALEPTTKVQGFCVPVNGTSGPQIAVEGGR